MSLVILCPYKPCCIHRGMFLLEQVYSWPLSSGTGNIHSTCRHNLENSVFARNRWGVMTNMDSFTWMCSSITVRSTYFIVAQHLTKTDDFVDFFAYNCKSNFIFACSGSALDICQGDQSQAQSSLWTYYVLQTLIWQFHSTPPEVPITWILVHFGNTCFRWLPQLLIAFLILYVSLQSLAFFWWQFWTLLFLCLFVFSESDYYKLRIR